MRNTKQTPRTKPKLGVTDWIFLAIIIGVGPFIYLRVESKKAHLKKHFTVVQGIPLTGISYKRKDGWYADYQYTFRGVTHSGSHSLLGLNPAERNRLLGHTYPLAVDTLAPSESMLLILPWHFSRLNLELPDSLMWVQRICTDDSGGWSQW